MKHPFRARTGPPGTRRRAFAAAAAGCLAMGLLAACSSDSDKPVLTWYINPDSGGQATVADNCSTDDYTIETQVLPQDAGQQRIQLARRLAAEDAGIDLMSIDPPFTAEFANAGFLAEIPQDLQDTFKERAFEGATKAASWEDQLVVAPFWSNTQVLWYRKSFVEKTDLNMDQPVTWDQIIDAAAKNNGTVAVQANKYEGYVVWINALISGAGGAIATDTEQGNNADITIDSEAGEVAAGIVEKLSNSKAAPADLSVAQEGQAGTTFGGDRGAFMTNWTYVLLGAGYAPEVVDDIGYTRYPQSVEGEDSRPPYGGIGIGVSEYSDEKDLALQALDCLTSPENQGVNAVATGNMPSSPEGYEYPELVEQFEGNEDLLELFQTSVENAAPRTPSPYWSDISGAIQSIWHPSGSVNADTPGKSKTFIEEVLEGKTLL